jgi:hypothetical protein
VRRTLEPSKIDPKKAREAIARHFQALMQKSGVNVTQFKAQIYEEEMVDMLAGFARDMTQPTSLRRQCAIDIITYARGLPKPWIHVGDTVNPEAEGKVGETVGQEINAARLTANIYQQLDELVRRGVHPDSWPADVRQAAGEALAYYSEAASAVTDAEPKEEN